MRRNILTMLLTASLFLGNSFVLAEEPESTDENAEEQIQETSEPVETEESEEKEEEVVVAEGSDEQQQEDTSYEDDSEEKIEEFEWVEETKLLYDSNSGKCGENINWSFDSNTGKLTITGSGDMYNYSTESPAPWIELKDNINTVEFGPWINNVGDYSFWMCSLSSIILPTYAKQIGAFAFYNSFSDSSSSLISLTLPSSLESIGESAFEGDSRLEMDATALPSKLTSIGKNAFSGCSNLKGRLAIPSGITVITDGAFKNCGGITGIDFPSSLTSIGEESFRGTGTLDRIVIPDTITELKYYAFGYVTTDELVLGSGLKKLINGPFNFCTIKRVIFTGDAPSMEGTSIPFTNVNTTGYYPENNATWTENKLTEISAWFQSISWVKSGDVSEFCGADITWSIDEDSKTLTLTGTGDTFNYSRVNTSPWIASKDKIENVVIGEGITGIGDYLFDNQTILSIDLPSTLKTIGSYAFYCSFNNYSNPLVPFTLPSGLESVGEYAFYNDHRLNVDLSQFPQGITDIGKYAFYGCAGMKGQLVIPERITEIKAYAFSGCSGMTGLELHSGITKIGEEAFRSIGKQERLVIPDAIKELGRYTFGYVTIGELVLGTGLKSIDGTFNFCKINKTIFTGDIPTIGSSGGFANVDTIGYYPEDNDTWTADARTALAKSFNSIIWVKSGPVSDHCGEDIVWNYDEDTKTLTLTGTGEMYDYSTDNAVPWIENCKNLNTVIVGEGITSIGAYAFQNSTILNISLPDTLETIREYAFYKAFTTYNSNATSFVLPKNLTYIGDYAFWYDSELQFKNADLPEGLTYIGKYAFSECRYFKGKLVIPSRVTVINKYSFGGTSLTGIEFHDNVTEIQDEAFRRVGNIGRVVIPDKVEKLSYWAFGYDTISELVIGTGMKQLEQSAFGLGTIGKVIFTGDIPTFSSSPFSGIETVAYYPQNNTTWTNEARNAASSSFRTVTWMPYGGTVNPTITVNSIGINNTLIAVYPGTTSTSTIEADMKNGGESSLQHIIVQPEGSSTEKTATYTFENLNNGNYVIAAYKDGYLVKTQNILTIDETSFDLTLRPMGDSTGDNKVDVSDIIKIRDIILGDSTTVKSLTDEDRVVANVNGDKSIDVSDIILVRDRILGVVDEEYKKVQQ